MKYFSISEASTQFARLRMSQDEVDKYAESMYNATKDLIE